MNLGRSILGSRVGTLRTYRTESRVSFEMVAGTVPVKRFLPMSLLDSHMRRSQDPHGAAPRERAQFLQPGQRRDARRKRAGERVLAQAPNHAHRDTTHAAETSAQAAAAARGRRCAQLRERGQRGDACGHAADQAGVSCKITAARNRPLLSTGVGMHVGKRAGALEYDLDA